MSTFVGGLAIAPLAATTFEAGARENKDWTVQEVIDLVTASVPGSPFKQTVDTLKAGSGSQKVTGIVTTMFATCEVITETAKLGANFIIAHEPTFYNHLDETEWLSNSEVYKYKRELLQKNNIAVWRCHDYVHAHRPDGVLAGVLNQLGWDKYADGSNPWILNMPTTSFGDLIKDVKKKLGIEQVRKIGNLNSPIKKVALIPGAAGGRTQINLLQNAKPDLLIVGEISEWETAEYVRDAEFMGSNSALLVLGHALSEEPGSEWMLNWLKPQLPGISITHIPAKNPLQFA
jgi:putative NIF3 family GTP cyclohydrolase 1 type 2